MKKKETVNQQEWKKEEARAKRLIKKYEKQGFTFDFEIPKKPKVITKKSLEEFKRQTRATKILSKGVRVVDQVTGETETARQAIQKKRSAASKAAWKRRKWIEIGPGGVDDGGDGDGGGGIGGDPPGVADVILKNFYDLCDYWAEDPYNRSVKDNAVMLRSTVDRFIEKYGKEAVAQAIEESALIVYFGIIVLYERECRNILDQIDDIADQIVLNMKKEEEKEKNGKKTDEK